MHGHFRQFINIHLHVLISLGNFWSNLLAYTCIDYLSNVVCCSFRVSSKSSRRPQSRWRIRLVNPLTSGPTPIAVNDLTVHPHPPHQISHKLTTDNSTVIFFVNLWSSWFWDHWSATHSVIFWEDNFIRNSFNITYSLILKTGNRTIDKPNVIILNKCWYFLCFGWFCQWESYMGNIHVKQLKYTVYQ